MGELLRVRVFVTAPYDTAPGQRFRIEQWEPHLRAEGIRIDYAPFLDAAQAQVLQQPGRVAAKARLLLASFLRRLRETPSPSACDLVYLFRESAPLGPALIERILVSRRLPYVFDFDDSVWMRYVSPTNSYFSLLRFPGKTATTCRLARAVMAGNSFLASYAGRYNGRVTVVPTTIDTDHYRPLPVRNDPSPVIGWTGSHSTARYLEIVRPALERLRRRVAFRVVVVGGEGFRAEGVEVEHRPWRAATEIEDLSDFQVGLMPLVDTEWERGKCGLKALQYMALGLPAVVSPVGVNRELIENRTSGRFAQSAEEWEQILHELLTDPDLRARMGRAARARVETGFAARVHAPRVAGLLREAAR